MKTRYYLALFGLAFSLRVGYDLSHTSRPDDSDAASFRQIALNLVTKGQYEIETNEEGPIRLHPTAMRPPSYVFFLAAIYKLFGQHDLVVRLIQAVMGLGLIGILMRTANELGWNSRVQWATGWMVAFYPFFIYYENQLLADAYLTFWLASSLLLSLRWMKQPSSVGRAVGVGLAFVALVLIKSLFIPLFVIVFGGVAFQTWRNRIRPYPWTSLAVCGLIFVLLLCAWGWRNQKVFGRFLMDSHGGRTMIETIVYHDMCKNGTFMYMWKAHPPDFKMKADSMNMNEAQKDAYFLAYTKQFIREHPLLYAKQSLVRFKDLWRFYPRQDIVQQDADSGQFSNKPQYPEGKRLITVISLLTEPVLILVGFFGLFKARRQWRMIYPFYFSILLVTVVHSLVTGQMRYRLPLMPILILFSAYAAFTPHHRPSDH